MIVRVNVIKAVQIGSGPDESLYSVTCIECVEPATDQTLLVDQIKRPGELRNIELCWNTQVPKNMVVDRLRRKEESDSAASKSRPVSDHVDSE